MNSKAYTDIVLGELRAARIRAQLAMVEIDTLGVAVKAGLMPPSVAMEYLESYGLRFESFRNYMEISQIDIMEIEEN